MVTHLSTVQAHSCLTLFIWPFSLLLWLMLVEPIGNHITTNFADKKQSTLLIHPWNDSQFAPHRYEPKVKAVILNGQISLYSTEMGDHLEMIIFP